MTEMNVEQAEQASGAKPRWGQARRLAFIDLRLQYDGKINRRDLQQFFDISTPQASADFDLYKKLAPENMEYDASVRMYVALQTFSPQFGRSSATSYLDELYRLERKVVERDESFVGFIPPTGVVATPARAIASQNVAPLVRAIRDRTVLKVLYHSMNEPLPVERVITPHAVGFDGLRWHVRAWCHGRKVFRDFAIGRLSILEQCGNSDAPGAESDLGWQTFVDVVLVPHESLEPSQRDAVMRDYGMEDGRLVLPCRKAMLFYTLRHLNLLSKKIEPNPALQQIIVKNRQDVTRWMEEDRELNRPQT